MVSLPLVCALVISFLPRITVRAQETFELDKFFRRAFLSREFQLKRFGPARWLGKGEAYTTLEKSSQTARASDLVRYDAETGKREVLIAAADLTPKGAEKPLAIEDYAWSPDANQVLIYTNSQKVWRANTRGDYWLFDRRTKALRKLGGDAAPATLMFAAFSRDGSRVAYVRGNNLHVESLQTGTITQLTRDGSESVINGTSDWVYEEELGLRDRFRWNPDRKTIAYWQFNTAGVKKFALIYNAGAPYDIVTHIPYPQNGIYPIVKEIPYPLPGTPNSVVRVGVVSAAGGETKWMQVPDDPTDNYIARIEWTEDSKGVLVQHLNRLQNTNDVLLADAATGAVQQVYRDHDTAWVDVVEDFHWLHGGKDFLWVSEQDGWRHVFVVSRDGKTRLVTTGAFDVVRVVGVVVE